MGTTPASNASSNMKLAAVFFGTLLLCATMHFTSKSSAVDVNPHVLRGAVAGMVDDDVKDMHASLKEARQDLKTLTEAFASLQSNMITKESIASLESRISTKAEMKTLNEALKKQESHMITKDSKASLQRQMIAKEEVSPEIAPAARGADVTTAAPKVRGIQPATCTLPKSARIISIKMTKAACLWEPVPNDEGSGCAYKLKGSCHTVHDKKTGCDFFGYPRNEQYQAGELVLPEPVPGEIQMTPKEQDMLQKPFLDCYTRPRHFMVAEPLLHDGKEVANMGTVAKPLVMMGGGSAGIAQHFYFVANEVAVADSYRLGWQKAKDMKLVVDIGANVGLFSISVCLRFPKARILAFEPHPANFRFLVYNIKAAGCENRVEAYNKGVSSDGRSLKLYWHDSIGTSAYRVAADYIRMETISPKTLFELVGSDPVSLLKIDCEGCEYEVIPGLPMARVQQMFCEVHGRTVHLETDDTDAAKKIVHDTCKAANKWGIVVFA